MKSGVQISDAFDEFGTLVPRVYTASLMAGERSGNLETVLRRYVAYARLMGNIRRKTLSALMYPMILVGLAVVVVSIRCSSGLSTRRIARRVTRPSEKANAAAARP